jgi:hypothetical protein
MSRKAGWIEAGAIATMLTACEGAPQPKYGGGTPAPDGVDYIMAVQCGGLLWALDAVWPDSGQLNSQAGLFRRWAETRARDSGQDAALAVKDIAASRVEFLQNTGGGTNETRRNLLLNAHAADVETCRSLARNADFVVIGG